MTEYISGAELCFRENMRIQSEYTCANKNITQRNIFEKELEESRNWLYTTLRSIGDAVIVTDSIGNVMFMNSAAQDITGWDEQTASGMYIEHIFNIGFICSLYNRLIIIKIIAIFNFFYKFIH